MKLRLKLRVMTTQNYSDKAQELSRKFNTEIILGFNYKEEACLVLSNSDKAKTLNEMGVAKGFRIAFHYLGHIISI